MSSKLSRKVKTDEQSRRKYISVPKDHQTTDLTRKYAYLESKPNRVLYDTTRPRLRRQPAITRQPGVPDPLGLVTDAYHHILLLQKPPSYVKHYEPPPRTLQYYLENGVSLYENGRHDEARNLFTEGITIFPKEHELWSQRAHCHRVLGHPYWAAVDAYHSLELKPTWVRGYLRLGNALMDMGAVDRAIDAYKKGFALDPSYQKIKEKLERANMYAEAPSEFSRQFKHAKFNYDGGLYKPLVYDRSETFDVEGNAKYYKRLTEGLDIHIGNTAAMGRGVFASRGFDKDDVICTEVPVASVCCEGNRCTYCGKPLTSDPISCPKCRHETYCTKECCDEAYELYHKAQCGSMAEKIKLLRKSVEVLGGNIERYFVMLTARLAGIALSAGHEKVFEIPNLSYLRHTRDEDRFTATELPDTKFEKMFAEYMVIRDTLGIKQPFVPWHYEWYTMVRSMLEMNIHSTLHWPSLCILGSYFNHSCIPNVLAFQSPKHGHRVVYKATRRINPGDELYVAYVDTKHPFGRRQELLSRYRFGECTCPKCKAEHTMPESRFHIDI